MRYESSEARSLDGYDVRYEERQASARPSFDVYEGAGLDARVRQGVTPGFLVWVKRAVLLGIMIVALGFVRVAISAATLTTLQANSDLETQIEDATNLYNDLKASKATLSSPDRVKRIATQNYGMVAADPEILDASGKGSTDADGASAATDASGVQSDAEVADSSNAD